MAIAFNRRTTVTPRWILRLFWLVTRQPKFRPLWPANVVSNDLLGQASFLAKAGFLIASGMMARAFVERTLKRLVTISPGWKQHRPAMPVSFYANFLLGNNIIDEKTAALIISVYDRTSQVCHNGKASAGGCHAILQDCRSLKRRFEEATRLVLSAAE